MTQPLFESKTLQTGQLYYQKDDKNSSLRINFSTRKDDDDPAREYKDEYIFDGIWLTHIDYQAKEVKRYQQAPEGKPIGAFDLISERFPIVGFSSVEKLEEQFNVTLVKSEADKSPNLVQLHLETKSGSEYKDNYKSVDLWIDTALDLPAKIVAVSTEQDIYQIDFIKLAVNKKIDKKIFEYKIPAGFTVESERLEE
jgi:outer membrane lipoprotein-sorting protein